MIYTAKFPNTRLRRNRINDSYSMKRKLEFIHEAKELYNRVITTPQNLKWLSIENEEKVLILNSVKTD